MIFFKKPLLLFLFFTPSFLWSQPYDILIKNGHVIDVKNNINQIMDIAIVKDKIALVAPTISAKDAVKVINASGLYVVPGLIDLHTHVFVGTAPDKFADGVNSVSPDNFTFKSGITTVVDAGTAGYKNFEKFKTQVIDKSQTRVLSFLNIAGWGISGNQPSLLSKNISLEEEKFFEELNVDSALIIANKYKNMIVGVKIGHFDGSNWTPFDRAISLAEKMNAPLFVECHLPQFSLEDQLNKMRPGDIITHSYEKVAERMPVVDEQGKLRPFVLAAKQRGIRFDVGHGGAGFWFEQAIPAFKQGLIPNSFGTDLHKFSVNAGMKSMLNVMSKFFTIGMAFEDIIAHATWIPAQSILREDLGNLSVGSVADIAVLSILEGQYGFIDAGGSKINGQKKLEAELTLRAGKVVWDLNGLNATLYKF